MTLFDECQEALSADFNMVEGKAQWEAVDILRKYPIINGNVLWSAIKYSDYDNIDTLLNSHPIENDKVFVFADDVGIPVFRSNLNLIAKNIYDVIALSPKLFIFNDEIIIQPLFPTEIFRLGVN